MVAAEFCCYTGLVVLFTGTHPVHVPFLHSKTGLIMVIILPVHNWGKREQASSSHYSGCSHTP